MTVTIVDRSDRTGAVAGELDGPMAGAHAGRVGDVADGPAMEAVFAEVAAARETAGPLRVLVCCAGVGAGRMVVRRSGVHDLALFEKVVRVNLVGTFNCARLAAAVMVDQTGDGEDEERGLIVTTSSAAAFDGVAGGSAYSASKAGVAGMTLPLARDLGRYGVRVVSIAPGPFETAMSATMPDDFRGLMAAETPFPPRFGRPEEFADAVVFLAGNPLMNGSVLRLDGGIRMRPESLRGN
jgi:NAD(P)-dependent dehydrogenase (short-subunit alcohol dehydrogenase family)